MVYCPTDGGHFSLIKEVTHEILYKNEEKLSIYSHIHHLSSEEIRNFHAGYEPVFFLTTGRSGSAFIEYTLKRIDSLEVYHEAFPRLMSFPNFAYHNANENVMLSKVFEASREELLLTAYLEKNIYVEANQCLVFFSKIIIKQFPNAKFVHLLRHPGDFVRSAIMKGWYKNDSIWENGRIRMSDENLWSNLSQLEKLSWAWKSIHNFIGELKESNEKQFFTVKFEDIVTSKIEFEKMISFINPSFNNGSIQLDQLLERKINQLVISSNEPPNMFKLNDYPKYPTWAENDKQTLRKHCGVLSEKYDYKLK